MRSSKSYTGKPGTGIKVKETGVSSAPFKNRKKPFGYDFVMGIPPSFLFLSLCIMFFVYYWQSRTLDDLLGRECQLTVRRVIDGDQFLANNEDGYLLRVRMRGIDAPELDQPWGRDAASQLGYMLNQPHTDVVAFFYERDHEGRYIGDVFTQTGISSEFIYVQEQMVKQGLAWHFGAVDRRIPLKEMMQNATEAKLGLWSESTTPVAPWKHRRQREREAKEAKSRGKSQRRGDKKSWHDESLGRRDRKSGADKKRRRF